MTRILPLNPRTAPLAHQAIKKGELIVLPTDTVYGVASLIDETSINRLFEAKGRPDDKPIPVLLSDPDRIERVCLPVSEGVQRLAEAFWPGPLTMVLPKKAGLPQNLTTLDTVGVRVPDHDLTRAIIRAAGGALAVTSANRSGDANPMNVQDAYNQLGVAVTYYMDDGPAPGGVPSTVVRVDEMGDIVVLREGPITRGDIEVVLRA